MRSKPRAAHHDAIVPTLAVIAAWSSAISGVQNSSSRGPVARKSAIERPTARSGSPLSRAVSVSRAVDGAWSTRIMPAPSLAGLLGGCEFVKPACALDVGPDRRHQRSDHTDEGYHGGVDDDGPERAAGGRDQCGADERGESASEGVGHLVADVDARRPRL